MFRRIRIVSLLLIVSWVGVSSAQKSLPTSVEALPKQVALPPLMRLSDGTDIKTPEQWKQRREEIKRMMLFYQYGSMPGAPDKVSAIDITKTEHKSGKGTEESLTLLIQTKDRPDLKIRLLLFRPKGDGPFPVVIREEGTLNGNDFVPTFLDNNYIFIEYARHDLDPDRKGVVGPAQQAYPEHDWATLSVWAWGGMRVVDYLAQRDDIDMKKIGITGHSRGGKMALLCGAIDERISLVVPNGSGAGGAGCYTMLGPGGESLSMNDKPHWYADRILMFAGHADRLPFDQHFLKALVAPRALLCIESVDDDYANPVGTQLSTVAAQPAFNLLKPDGSNKIHNGLTYRNGPHTFNQADWQNLLTFAEWHFRDVRPDSRKAYAARPYDLPRNWYAGKGIQKGVESQRVSTENQASLGNDGFSRIGEAGNEHDEDHFGMGRFGAVDYPFEIANRQVTNAEYAAFLNAVYPKANKQATVFDADMAIELTRKDGGRQHFAAKGGSADQAVTHVTWQDAARYCNWLHNGQPKGTMSLETTEEGAYSISDRRTVGTRNPDARFAIPNENEWYKAAYFHPQERTYGLYSRKSNGDVRVVDYDRASVSKYGVSGLYDRLWEWNENPVNGVFRALRSGAWFVGNNRQCAGRLYSNPDLQLANIGFRVVKTDAENQKAMPHVLILGDSISMGYTNRVRRRMAGRVRVMRPNTNCGPTTRGLADLDDWLAVANDGKWDVIHFNFGLHDLKYINEKAQLVPVGEGKIQVPIEEYEKNIAAITRRLKATGAMLIWCTTTPVPEGAKGRIADYSVRYNEAALRAVKSVLGDDTIVDDLHAYCQPRLEKMQQRANVHFFPAGSEELADVVTKAIDAVLTKSR